jgi:outer membrane protein assembly factor BamB
LAFDRADGSPRGAIGEAGGVFCILSEDETLLAGPPHQKEKDNQIRIADIRSKQPIASFSGTNRILVAGDLAWLSLDGKLKLLDRAGYVKAQGLIDRATSKLKKAGEPVAELEAAIETAKQQQLGSWKWSVESRTPVEMIMADDVILLGLANEVRALGAHDGKEIWRASVEGAAHGLAVAGGRLLVSTDRGHIYAFGAAE